MRTLDRQPPSLTFDGTAANARTRPAHGAAAPVVPHNRRRFDPVVIARPQVARHPRRRPHAGIDPALRRWMPAVAPMLALLICACILAIWSML